LRSKSIEEKSRNGLKGGEGSTITLDWRNEGAFPERKGLEIQFLYWKVLE